jgi:argininosuccinate lyase
LRPSLEDVHTNIEKYLTDELGIEAGLAMHTARSRNDQVVTDMRLWMRHRVIVLAHLCLDLMQQLSTVAQLHRESVMAGYTHHQHATISTSDTTWRPTRKPSGGYCTGSTIGISRSTTAHSVV